LVSNFKSDESFGSLDQLRVIFDRMPARVWYKDSQNKILRLNKAAADSMGLTVEAAEGADTYDLYPEVAKKYHEDDLNVFKSGKPLLGIVEEYKPLNGPHGWVRTDKIPYTDPATGKQTLLVMAVDITDEINLKAALEEQKSALEGALEKLKISEERFVLVTEGLRVGIWDWSLQNDGPIFWSDVCCELFGYTQNDMPKNIQDAVKMIHPDDYDRYTVEMQHCLEKQLRFKMELRMQKKDGEYRWFQVSGEGQWKDDGTPIRMLGSTVDIDNRKVAELQAETHLKQLESVNSDLENFAYLASHDLKTPLRGIDNLSIWIQQDIGDAVSSDAAKKFDLLRDRVARMEAMLKDILSFSQAGQFSSPPEFIELEDLIDEVINWIDPPGSFRIMRKTKFPKIVMMKTAMEQIYLNLISNAIKHHNRPDGLISLDVKEHPRHYEFLVKDDGQGIPDEYQKYVFQLFKKMKSRDEVFGSGIGLAIVKKMVESVGGKIWLEPSKPDQGAEFHFTIPKTLPHFTTQKREL